MDTNDRLVDVQELALYLQIPVKTLYAWRYRRIGPPAIRVGRRLRYRWEDIAAWLADLADGPRERRSSPWVMCDAPAADGGRHAIATRQVENTPERSTVSTMLSGS